MYQIGAAREKPLTTLITWSPELWSAIRRIRSTVTSICSLPSQIYLIYIITYCVWETQFFAYSVCKADFWVRYKLKYILFIYLKCPLIINRIIIIQWFCFSLFFNKLGSILYEMHFVSYLKLIDKSCKVLSSVPPSTK